MRRAALALAAVAGCSAAPAPGTSPLPSVVPPRAAAATLVGRVDSDARIDFVLALALRDRARAEALVAGGEVLAPDAFADAFAPTPAEYAAVVAALGAQGLQAEPSPTRTTVTVHGRASDVEAALGTTLSRYADAYGVFRAPAALHPRWDLEALVAGAAGLDDAARWWTHLSSTGAPVAPNSPNGSAEPPDFKAMYDLGGAGLGDGETVAILGTGTPPSDADLDGYATRYALPFSRATQYTQVFVGGANRDPPGLSQNEYYENVLDADMVMALAPHARIVHVLTATNSPGLFSDGIVYIVNQLAWAHQVSVSFGTCERVAASEMLVLNQLFLQARAEGQQWLFASGDNGTDGCRDGKGNKVLSVNWPSSSPYVLSVGGTGWNMGAEYGWSGGGGGQSEILDKPAYQVAQPGDTRARTPADGVRDQPDVAALAGPPGVVIYAMNQSLSGVQGTSAATPMWAAIWALLDEARGGHRGFADGAERLYRMGASGGAGLHDITTGGNGDGTTPGFAATPGWDFATGWGTPDVGALVTTW